MPHELGLEVRETAALIPRERAVSGPAQAVTGQSSRREEKEELEEILKQGREEIDRMEAENKEELKRLEEIKAKAIDVNGVEFVEDLCNSIAEELEEERQERDREESSDTDSSGSY